MSWSISGIGRPEPLAKKLSEEFTKITYLGKDECALKDIAAGLVDKALSVNTFKNLTVKVFACGSGNHHPADGGYQGIEIKIEPIHGFIE